RGERRRPGRGRPDLGRRGLWAYAMSGGREPRDPGVLAEWRAAGWQRTLPGAAHEAERRALGDHLAALVEAGFAPVPPDEALVSRVLDVLGQPTAPMPRIPNNGGAG
ncbi:type VI secretion system membrane subunit TssM, partial [Azospirillum brasilense]|nr:type VI secretion system membrane subunit TssM [Azospirillum brasilense]